MFTRCPTLLSSVVDEYAGSVLALLHFAEADGTATTANALGSATITNDGSASAPATNAVKSASAKFGAGGWLSAGGSTGLKVSKNTAGLTAPYTLEFFVKFATLGGFGRFFNAATSGSGILYSLAAAAGAFYYVDATGTNQTTTGGTATTGVWYHFAITYDGTTLKVYKDGAQIYSTTASPLSLNGTVASLGLGCSVGAGGADGTASFDEFRWTQGVNRYPSGLTVPSTEYPS